MQIVYLGIVFAVIIILLAFKRPLYQAILGGLLATILFYRIPPMEIANIFCTVIAVSHYVFTENSGIPRPDPSGAAEFKCGFS